MFKTQNHNQLYISDMYKTSDMTGFLTKQGRQNVSDDFKLHKLTYTRK